MRGVGRIGTILLLLTCYSLLQLLYHSTHKPIESTLIEIVDNDNKIYILNSMLCRSRTFKMIGI